MSAAVYVHCRDTYEKLAGVWAVMDKAKEYMEKSAQLEKLLSDTIPQIRGSLLLTSLSTGG